MKKEIRAVNKPAGMPAPEHKKHLCTGEEVRKNRF